MNYRHIFHAGNAADVFKHLVLIQVLEHLAAKEAGFCAIDTHAGSGKYQLAKDGENRHGIDRLWSNQRRWPVLSAYFSAIAAYNSGQLEFYPGSPALIADRLRIQDRAVLIEKNPGEFNALDREFGDRRGVACHRADGFSMLGAVVPPKENRGVVFVDPPYESLADYELAFEAIRAAIGRWRNGIFAVWYPIKHSRSVAQLHEKVRTLGIAAYAAEFLTLPEDVQNRLNGSGMLLLNPPYRLDAWMSQHLPELASFLAPDSTHGRFRIVGLAATGSSQKI